MTLVLFDIDLTLVDAAGAGRQALDETFHELYGVVDAFEGVRFHGRTDARLMSDALARYEKLEDGKSTSSESFVDLYIGNLARSLPARAGHVLPGVPELLTALNSMPGVSIGLATGNFRRGAETKLSYFGLLELVRHGGFGDDVTERKEVIAAGARYFGRQPGSDGQLVPDVVVVGDTALEVVAAKTLGFTSVGVATGFDTADELRAAGADLVFDDFGDTEAVIGALQEIVDLDGSGPARPPAPAPAVEVDRHEVEAKLEILDTSVIESFLARGDLAGTHVLGDVRSVRLMDTYYDTWDRALVRRGLSLRVRCSDESTKVTVKGLQNLGAGVVHRRLEQQITFDAVAGGDDEPDVLDPLSWSDEMRSTVSAVTGPEPEFLPLCLVGHDRHVRDVYGVGGDPGATGSAAAPMGELCVETVVVYRPVPDGGAPTADDAVAEYAELELELATGGSMSELEAVVEWLSDQPSLAPASASKLQRGLRLVAAHPPGFPPTASGVQPEMPMAEAGRLTWRRQLVEMLLNEAGSRQGADIEFVHDMRVSTRRARASGVLFAEWYKPRKIKPFRTGLRTSGRRLGAVRDLDVALHKLDRYAESRPKGERKELKALAKHWRRMRRRAYVDLLDWLDSAEYRRFISKFDKFCTKAGKGALAIEHNGAAVPYQVRHVMPMAIFDRYVAVRAYETVLEGDGASKAAESTLHALRIECKYLRYSLEMVRHLLGGDGEVLIKQLKKLQDHLGDFNDAVVARDTLKKMKKKGVGGPAVEHYIDVQVDTARRLRAEFPPVWDSFMQEDNRELLLRALSRL